MMVTITIPRDAYRPEAWAFMAGERKLPEGSRLPAVKDFLNYHAVERLSSPLTVQNYHRDLRKLDGFLPSGMGWGDVTRADMRAFLAHLQGRGYTPKSIRRYLSAIKSFFNFLVSEGYAEHTPTEGITGPKVPQLLPKYLPWEQVEALIEAPLKAGTGTIHRIRRRDRAMLEVLAATGVRISELLGLTLSDVGLNSRPSIRVFGKGSKERVIPLMERTAGILRQYVEHHRPKLNSDSDWLFPARDSDRPPSRTDFYQQLRRYAKVAGIKGRVYPHLLRHSFATGMTQGGMPLLALAEVLGHTNVNTTAIYAHVTPEYLRASYDSAWANLEAKGKPVTPTPARPSIKRNESLLRTMRKAEEATSGA